MKSENRPMGETGLKSKRFLKRPLFYYLLDLEVKRAYRYQNSLCLLILRLKGSSKNGGHDFQAFYQILATLLSEEIRETDLVGYLSKNAAIALLPYADTSAGDHVKSRLEGILKSFKFKNKGFEVAIDQLIFPEDGTNTKSLMKKALRGESS